MNTKQALIDSYLSLGMKKGFDNVSLQELADTVGIKKASIFSHFKDFKELKNQAINYCNEVLSSKKFEINPKDSNSEKLFLNLINSFIDVFAEYPVNALLSFVEQQHSYNEFANRISDQLNMMLISRFQVALDFCVQRSWSESNCTDELAILYAAVFRKLLAKRDFSDNDLEDMLGIILATI